MKTVGCGLWAVGFWRMDEAVLPTATSHFVVQPTANSQQPTPGGRLAN